MLDSLSGEWITFQQILLDSEQMLKRHKEKFKTGLIHAADDFKKKAHNLLEDFEVKGIPYSTSLPFFSLGFMTQNSKCYPGKVKTGGVGGGMGRFGAGRREQAAQEREGASRGQRLSSPGVTGFWSEGLGQQPFQCPNPDFLLHCSRHAPPFLLPFPLSRE